MTMFTCFDNAESAKVVIEKVVNTYSSYKQLTRYDIPPTSYFGFITIISTIIVATAMIGMLLMTYLGTGGARAKNGTPSNSATTPKSTMQAAGVVVEVEGTRVGKVKEAETVMLLLCCAALVAAASIAISGSIGPVGVRCTTVLQPVKIGHAPK
jgi:hypothetical protein